MNKNSFYISFGVWIAILPFLGIPGSWRNTLVFLSGLFLILVSIGPAILKKLQIKPKPKKRQNKTNPPNQTPQINELKFTNMPLETLDYGMETKETPSQESQQSETVN